MGKWGCHGNISNPFGALAGVTSVGGNRRASTSKSWLSSSQPTSPTSTALMSNLTNVPSSRRQWDRSDKSRSKVTLQITHTLLVINKATYKTYNLTFSVLFFGSKWWIKWTLICAVPCCRTDVTSDEVVCLVRGQIVSDWQQLWLFLFLG